MNKKIACLTGATDGIGKQVALKLANLGYDLVIIGRNPAKGRYVTDAIKAICPSVNIEFTAADLTLVSDTRKTAASIGKSFKKIDILYQSAGIIPRTRKLTREGIEESFAVSFLSRYVLTRALLPNVLRSEDKLLLTIASPHPGGNHSINFNDINLAGKNFSSNNTVRQFQEANDIYSLILQENFAGKGLRTYCINPGIVNTGIHSGWPPLLRFFLTKVIGRFLMVEPEQAAEMIIGLAEEKNLEKGPLISNKGKTLLPVARVLDKDYQNRFIELMESLTGKP